MKNPTTTARIRLIEERKRHMWSQQELADLLGTTQNTVSRWELGKTTPSPYFAKKMCEIFGKCPQEIGLFDEQTNEEQFAFTSVSQHAPLWHVFANASKLHFTGREDLLHQPDQHRTPEEDADPTITTIGKKVLR